MSVWRNQFRSRWKRKPPMEVGPDRSHPLCPKIAYPFREGGGLTVNDAINGPSSPHPVTNLPCRQGIISGGRWTISPDGHPAWASTATTDFIDFGPSGITAILGEYAAFETTVVLRCMKTDGALRQFIGLWGDNGAPVSRFGAWMPYQSTTLTNNRLLWDFGDAAVGQGRLDVSGIDLSGHNTWIFTSGARGLEIWRNGILVGFANNQGADSNRDSHFTIGEQGSGNTPANDLVLWDFIWIYDRQVRLEEIQTINENPYIWFNMNPERLTFFPATSVPVCSLSFVNNGNGTITLTWTTGSGPSSASINQGIGAVNPAGGSLTIPLPATTTTYILTVTNVSGSSTCQTTVSILAPTCTLSAVVSGTQATLTWTTTNQPTSATINNGIGAVNPFGGSLTITPPPGTTTYILTVSNSAGTSTCQATVTITCVPVACNLVPPLQTHEQTCELLGS